MKRARRDNLIPAKMTTMASSMWQLKNKLQAHEIAMRISEMIMWLFHLAVKKQNINK